MLCGLVWSFRINTARIYLKLSHCLLGKAEGRRSVPCDAECKSVYAMACSGVDDRRADIRSSTLGLALAGRGCDRREASARLASPSKKVPCLFFQLRKARQNRDVWRGVGAGRTWLEKSTWKGASATPLHLADGFVGG